MAKYRKVRKQYVEDRRGQRSAGRGPSLGGGGLGGGLGGLPVGKIGLPIIILIVVVSICQGGLPDLGNSATEPAPNVPAGEPNRDAEFERINSIVADLDDTWTARYAAANEAYRSANVVLFEGVTNSACGGARSEVGPHYCPLDETIYLDLGFFDQLRSQFGARGEFAIDYVVAHEFAHHIQTVDGINEAVRNAQQQNPAQANDLSIAMELQADCLAGVWVHDTLADDAEGDATDSVIIESGDVQEALQAAAAVGDDRIQETVTGRVDPESWTHGSSEQRAQWFNVGFENGDTNACNTFG